MTTGHSSRALAICFGALLVAACGAGPVASLGHETAVSVTDSSIAATPAALGAGDVTLNITNNGGTLHEVEVFTLPAGVDVNNLQVAGHLALVGAAGMEIIDEVEGIIPGAKPTLTVNLEPGTYALLCNLPGHYALGMRSTISVQ